jgi:hypothetical protein
MQKTPYSYNTPDEMSMIIAHYFQEEPDLCRALDLNDAEKVTDQSVALIIICRAIEILNSHSFDSEVYQRLLKNKNFVDAILAGCQSLENDAKSTTASGPKSPRFSWLAKADTYLKEGQFEQHIGLAAETEMELLLREYCNWYLVGGNIPHQDLDEIFEVTGIMDPIDDIPVPERILLVEYFPSLWLALLRLKNSPENDRLLWDLITKAPSGVPDFDCLELWLQRRATFNYFDLHGFAPLLNSIDLIRPVQFEFLACARAINVADRNTFLERTSSLPEYQNPENVLPREWYWKRDYLKLIRND